MIGETVPDKVERGVYALKGISSEMIMMELLIEEAEEPTHSAPSMKTLAESLGAIRMHLERVAADLEEVLAEILRQKNPSGA